MQHGAFLRKMRRTVQPIIIFQPKKLELSP